MKKEPTKTLLRGVSTANMWAGLNIVLFVLAVVFAAFMFGFAASLGYFIVEEYLKNVGKSVLG